MRRSSERPSEPAWRSTRLATSAPSKDDTMIRQPWALCALLLPLVASCSPPPGRYQKATVSTSDGRLCFGVPDTRETRSAPPEIAIVSVSEVGRGLYPVWQRRFLDEHLPEPALPPDECVPYGSGPAPFPALQAGTYYQVLLSGYTPGDPHKEGEGEKRVFIACFHLRQATDGSELKPVVLNCYKARRSAVPAA